MMNTLPVRSTEKSEEGIFAPFEVLCPQILHKFTEDLYVLSDW
jgi:hypothetical protein